MLRGSRDSPPHFRRFETRLPSPWGRNEKERVFNGRSKLAGPRPFSARGRHKHPAAFPRVSSFLGERSSSTRRSIFDYSSLYRRGTVVLPLWRARRVSNPSGISLEKCLFPWNRPASFSREYALSFFFLLRAEEAQRWSLSLSLFLSLSPLLCFLSSARGKTFTGTPPGKKTLPFIRFQRPVIFVRAELYDAPKLFLFFSFGYGSGLSVAISPAGRSKSQMDRCVRLMHVLPQVSSRRVHFKWRRGILQWRTFESHDNLTFNWI